MFWLLLSHAYPKSRSLFSVLCQCVGTQKQGESRSSTDQRGIPCHRWSCPAYKLGDLAGSCRSQLGARPGINQQMVTRCSVHHLWGLEVYSSLSFSLCKYYFDNCICLFMIFFFTSIIKLFLSQPKCFIFFLLSPQSHCWQGRARVVSEWFHFLSAGIKPHKFWLFMEYLQFFLCC